MHSLVIVLGDDWESLLAPFDVDGGPSSDHLEFVDLSSSGQAEYDAGSTEMLVLADGTRLHAIWSEVSQYVRRLTEAERAMDWHELKRKFKVVFGTNDHMEVIEAPPGAELRHVPFREHYPDFASFMHGWHGAELLPETGRYGHWENPKARWDWYSMGGRWAGFFTAKPGRTGQVGEPGLFRLPPEAARFDQMRKADIDFPAMEASARDKAGAVWDDLSAQIPPGFFDGLQDFETVQARYPKDRLSEAKAFAEYWRQPAAMQFKGGLMLAGKSTTLRAETARDMLASGRAAYVEGWARAAWVPTAIIADGHWTEEVGGDYQAWVSRVRELILTQPDDTIMTAVDCHS